MKWDNTIFLTHILDSIEAIESFIGETYTKKDLMSSRKTKDAVLHNFAIIGEAVHNLDENFVKNHEEIEWDKINAMRNIIIHEYFGVDINLVWDTIKVDLPVLKEQIKMLMR